MKKLKVNIGGKDFYADFLEDKAPVTCAAIEAAGKFECFVFSAKICSNEITWNTPCEDLDILENPVFYEDPGNVVLYPAWNAICVFSGPTEPVGECTLFAKFTDDLPGFAEEAAKVWYKQGGRVTTEVVEVEA